MCSIAVLHCSGARSCTVEAALEYVNAELPDTTAVGIGRASHAAAGIHEQQRTGVPNALQLS